MARYGKEGDIKLALRVPEDAKSWEDGDYDDLLEMAALEADKRIDEICPLWSPFDGGQVEESRTFLATAAAYSENILVTDPYKSLPSIIEIDGRPTGIKVKALHKIAEGVGKDLGIAYDSPYGFEAGMRYGMSTTWGYSAIPPGVKLSFIRIGCRSFTALRQSMGVMEVAGAAVYEPRHDPQIKLWLGRYMGGDAL